MSDDDENDIEDTIDMIANFAKKAADVYDSSSHIFDAAGTVGDDIDISDSDNLREVHLQEESVLIVAEVDDDSFGEMGVNFMEEYVELLFNGKTLRANIPDDVVEDSLDASMNNGVLRVEIARDKTQSDNSVDVTTDVPDGERQSIDEIIGEDREEAGDGPVNIDAENYESYEDDEDGEE